jgi:NAD dependent epimerase/dehydratase family enzyme
VRFVIAHDEARGPINAVAPNPVTNAELARAIGVVLGRRSWLRVPRFAVRLRLGEAAEFVVTGQRVVPARALDLGYSFEFPTLEPALSAILR